MSTSEIIIFLKSIHRGLMYDIIPYVVVGDTHYIFFLVELMIYVISRLINVFIKNKFSATHIESILLIFSVFILYDLKIFITYTMIKFSIWIIIRYLINTIFLSQINDIVRLCQKLDLVIVSDKSEKFSYDNCENYFDRNDNIVINISHSGCTTFVLPFMITKNNIRPRDLMYGGWPLIKNNSFHPLKYFSPISGAIDICSLQRFIIEDLRADTKLFSSTIIKLYLETFMLIKYIYSDIKYIICKKMMLLYDHDTRIMYDKLFGFIDTN
jgi:hypothetical protein